MILCESKKPLPAGKGLKIEATTGFEPVIKVLQTSALPLGHVARKQIRQACGLPDFRAGNEIRTRGLLLGKETFYH